MNDFLYEINQNLVDEKRDITIIDRRKFDVKYDTFTKHNKKYKYRCNKCGYDCGEAYKDGEFQEEYWIYEGHLKNGVGCACCQGRAVVKGINDVATTAPHLAKLLKNEEDTHRVTKVSRRKLEFVCPICGHVRINSFTNISTNGFICPNCSDKMPMGEKIMYVLLSSIGVPFIKEYSSNNCDWSGRYRYDFYIEPNTIIEIMGSQHYDGSFVHLGGRSENEEKENDMKKKELALSNGITNYIEINTSMSDFNYIKESICSSKFAELYDLSNIDWKQIELDSMITIIKEISDYWTKNQNCTLNDLSSIFHLNKMTISKYLVRASKLGMCIYNRQECVRRNMHFYDNDSNNASQPIRCIENNTYFKSITLCSKLSKEVFGIQLNDCSIRSVIKGKYSHHRNLHFENVTKQEFNKAITDGLPCYGSPFYF